MPNPIEQAHRLVNASPYDDGYCADCGHSPQNWGPTCTPREWPGKVYYPEGSQRSLPLHSTQGIERMVPIDKLPRDVTPASVWQHRNGNLYTVLFLANENERPGHECTVVYVGPTARMWTRPLRDWHRSFTRYEPPQGSA
jgi:hypothetical protein